MGSLGRPVLIVDWGQIGLAEDDLTNRLIDAISHISDLNIYLARPHLKCQDIEHEIR